MLLDTAALFPPSVLRCPNKVKISLSLDPTLMDLSINRIVGPSLISLKSSNYLQFFKFDPNAVQVSKITFQSQDSQSNPGHLHVDVYN